MRAKILSVVNQKGGVGKTTTAINLATVLAIMEKQTLLIDLDAQGNSSSGLGISQSQRLITSYHVLSKINDFDSGVYKTDVPNLYIMPSNTNLAAIELELINKPNYEEVLKNLLCFVQTRYEYIIVDCPPSLNVLTLNSLVASQRVMIPMICDFFSLEGLSHLIKTIDSVKKNLNSEIKVGGIVFTMYDKRNKLTQQVEQDVRSFLGDLVYNSVIPRNVKIAEAPSYGKPVVLYDHRCSGAKAYIDLAKEFIKRETYEK